MVRETFVKLVQFYERGPTSFGLVYSLLRVTSQVRYEPGCYDFPD